MSPVPSPDGDREVLREDADRVVVRLFRDDAQGGRHAVLAVYPAAERPASGSLRRLEHEYGLRDILDSAWALRPLAFVREDGRPVLLLDSPNGEPLARLLGSPMEMGMFLSLAVALSAALGRTHQAGLIHKDIKPANIFANPATGEVRLTGFGIASRLPRERQPPKPPELIEGTLAYMAPEQTGRMNRSIDSRSDLYSLGITLYEMLTGGLPFTASAAMELVHCHIARTPAPPHERLQTILRAVSAIIMKLLAKTAEERYQTAVGVERDLQRCLAEWQTRRLIDEFPLGAHDMPDRLLIPEKLYGRDGEIDTLLASFDRVVVGGRPELVLVSGYSGVGKSSVVNELHKSLVPPRGHFASGKFDQHRRDIPYATLAQAFQGLVRALLGKSEAELRSWRSSLRDALGPNGLLMADLVPELQFVIGEQAPVPALPPHDAQRRFRLVLRRFIAVFARPEHPLVLFLDDLQWLDAATLEVLEDLLCMPDVQHLLLIGAYRDNEVSAAHPLMRKLDALRAAGATVRQIVLAPLASADLQQLISESLRCEMEGSAPLAQLAHEKTAGNPFFAIQFLSSLAEDRLLMFDHAAARWSWDLNRIHAKGYTDNVVDLMVAKLHRLPAETLAALQHLACLGNSADIALLRMGYPDIGGSSSMDTRLWEAIRAGLVLRTEDSYKFLHDRVQEATYSMIPESARAAAHLRIGRLLAERTAPEEIEANVFEIASQLNRGGSLITSAEERRQLAELNLLAARRAKDATAYASALQYLAAGRALLTEQSWIDDYDLIFTLEALTAEGELLTADTVAAEYRLSMLAERAKSKHDIVRIIRLRLTLYTILARSDRSVDVCLEYLRRSGTDWSPHPNGAEVLREYDRIWSLMGSRSIEDLVDLPLLVDADVLDTLEVLAEVVTPALYYDQNLCSLVICRMVNLSLEHGNTDSSCFAYVRFAMIAGPRFGNYADGFRVGRLGYELVEKRGLKRYQARTYMIFGNIVMPWTRHVRDGRELIGRAFDAANESGDLTFAAYSCNHLVTNMLAAGDQLAEVQREAETGLEFARRMRFGHVIDHIVVQLQLIRSLRGSTPTFGSFDDAEFSERDFERHLASNPVLAEPEFWYCARKVQARFLMADLASALDAASRAEQLLWTSPSQFETAEYRFYAALTLAADWSTASPERRPVHFEALTAHHRQLDVWAKHCPENFENRAALVGAEIARIEGRDLDAERLYEQAARSANASGFVHNEALANELAARFYAARGFERIALTYLRDARYGYLRWGATGKARQLEQQYPQIREDEAVANPTGTIGATVEHLDLATVTKVLEAVSGEIVMETLIDTLMRTAIAHAGAERGLLILRRGEDYRIEAEATTGSDTVVVSLRQADATDDDLPESIFQYVLRTKANVLLDDASGKSPFSADDYIRRRSARSILCLPLLKQSRLVGVLYLENNLAPHVFTPTRMAILRLLAAEAAISLESTRLYRDLQEREARIRRLVDSNIIGIFIWGNDGRCVDANEAFLRIVGFNRDDLLTGGMSWRELTPPEWHDTDDQRMAEVRATGTVQPYEKEFFRKGGGRVPILIGAATFNGDGDQGVAFVLDLTDRKRAESAARESERRYHDVQLELAHANRIAMLGQLSASIAHEVNQPIAAVVTNAHAALRWLGARPSNIDEVRQALGRIVKDGNRASDVVGRIRALIKKAPLQKDSLEINDVILEIVALSHGEAVKNGVSVRTQLAAALPLVQGDRVQLQQVILNLIINAVEAMRGLQYGARELLISTARAEPQGVFVAVQDSGPGLAQGSGERVFDAFYTTKPGGLGMGLSICRSIIDAHGGRLWVDASGPHGAIFKFTLPAYAVHPA